MNNIDNQKVFYTNKKSNQQQKFLTVINLLLAAVSVTLLIVIIIRILPLFQKEDQQKNKTSHTIQVEVLNACGTAGLADQFTDLLRSKKFDVVKTGNFTSFDVDNSFVIDRAGKKEYAYALADSIGISKSNVIQQFNKNYYLDVTLVIGKDFNNFLNQ